MTLTKLKKILSVLLCSLFSFVTLSCAKVVVNDAEWCADLGSEGAFCYHTVTPNFRSVVKPDWEAQRVGMMCTTAANFAELKKALLYLCIEKNYCELH